MSDSHFEFLRDNHPQLKSRRGEWRLPDPPALISEHFNSSLHATDYNELTLRYIARYSGINDKFMGLYYLTPEVAADALDMAKDVLRQEGVRFARVRVFSGPEPILSGSTRKAKRLHREARRLYKWRKKWAERQV